MALNGLTNYWDIVLFSGGIDSATLLYHIGHSYLRDDRINNQRRLTIIEFEYPNRPKGERLASSRIINNFLERFPGLHRHIKRAEIDLSLNNKRDPYATFSLFFLSLIEFSLKNISGGGVIRYHIATIMNDWILNPNVFGKRKLNLRASPIFIHFLFNMIKLEYRRFFANYKFVLKTPFIFKTKRQIIKMADRYGVPLFETWSCVNDHEKECGKCYACREKLLYLRRSRFKKYTNVKVRAT